MLLKSRSLRDLPGLNESDWPGCTFFVTGHCWLPPQQRLCARVEAELLKAGEFLASSIKSLFIGCRKSYTGEKNAYLQAQLGSGRVFKLFHKPNYIVITWLSQCR